MAGMTQATDPAVDITTPHFAWPFRLGADGAFAVVEQDSLDEVVDCVVVLASTQIGSREELPDYGIEDPTFTNEVDLGAISSAIANWEERASVDLSQSISSQDELIRNVTAATGLE